MQTFSQNSEPPPLDDGECSCFFNTYVNMDGDICFSCGWSEQENSIDHLAELMFKLSVGKIIPLALNNLREQSLDDDSKQDFDLLIDKISELMILSTENLDDPDGPLIPPTRLSP